MRTVREILRLRFEAGLSPRQVAKSCNVARSTVQEYEKKVKEAGLGWEQLAEMDDDSLKQAVRSRLDTTAADRPMPDINHLIKEMKRPHVTLQLLWMEYRQHHPNGYGYTQFCHHYNKARNRIDVTMRQEHKAGEKLFTDYAGDAAHVTDPATGEIKKAWIFVAVLGASNYTYAEAVLTMSQTSWIESHVRAIEYIGGVPRVIVPDNTKCAVIKPDRYEPDLNQGFADMAAHYGCAVIPARVRKPRDKAKVENGVLIVERWILAALRNRTFFSLSELNEAISELLDKLNERQLKRVNTTRRELYERIEKNALLPLPARRYEFCEWKQAKAGIDYHVLFCKHFYSVPYQYAGMHADIRASTTCVEILYGNRRIASHRRSYVDGGYTTNPAHMPPSHRKHQEWNPERFIAWAAKTGNKTAALVEQVLAKRVHPEQAYRSCFGIMKLADRYDPQRMEAAADRALISGAISYKSLKSILDLGLDKLQPKEAGTHTTKSHANIRGKGYYE